MQTNDIMKVENGIVYFVVLSKGKIFLAKVDLEDWEKISESTWSVQAGSNGKALSMSAKIAGKMVKLHHLILGKPLGGQVIDHINGYPLDNRKENLRFCTPAQNSMNRASNGRNKSGYRGVCWNKKNRCWFAHITVNGMNTYLGSFQDPYEASLAYQRAAVQKFGEFARKI